MFSLLYVSAVRAELSAQQVNALAVAAAAANAARQITGLLAYNGRNFMQLLEGPEGAVRATMQRIARDPRHGDIVYLRTDQRASRECPDWAMRSLLTPLSGAGSATRFGDSLPAAMAPDSRLLFTSFASILEAA